MLEHSTINNTLIDLANTFEAGHSVLNDAAISINYPNLFGIMTPAIKASPLDLFVKAVERIGSRRKTLNTWLTEDMVPRTGPEVYGNDVSLRVEAGALQWSAWIGSTDFETLAATLVLHGMLHQVFAEFGGYRVGPSQTFIERLEWLGEPFVGDSMLWGTIPQSAGPRMLEGVGDFLTLGEDLAMLTRERVVIGLRTQWARRVAVPIFHAHKNLQGRQANPVNALQIVAQCADESLAFAMSTWIKANHKITWENKELV